MSRIRLIVPVTPRREWRNVKVPQGERILAASPIVRGYGARRANI